MSKLSYTLFKNDDGTWRAEIPFPGRKNGISVHQTGEKDRARAERSAKIRCRRLPLEDRARKRHREKVAKGTVERSGIGKPGRPRKVPLPPVPPAIDPTVTAAKLRALPVDSGAGPVEPEVPSPVPAPGPAPENSPPAPPAEPLPELPDTPPPGEPPITPEVGDDRTNPDAEGNEFFADVAATAVVAGTIKVCHSYAEKKGKRANEPSPKAIEWYTEGLQFRFRQLMGNAALTPTTKLLVGAGGVILSMLWGAPDLPESGQAPRNGESRRAAAPPPAPSHEQEAAEPDTDHEQWEEPEPRAITNGHGAASGTFR